MARKLCEPCSALCLSCNGTSPFQCMSCGPPFILNNGSCVNSCPDGKFINVQDSVLVCEKCDKSCLTCAGNATACTSCRTNYSRHEDGKCVKSCAEGQYADSNEQCQSCHPSCRNCNDDSASSCTACGTKDDQQLLFLHKGECMASCPSSLFADTGNHECKHCDGTCGSCSGPSSSECKSCNQGRFLLGSGVGVCVLHCPEGELFICLCSWMSLDHSLLMQLLLRCEMFQAVRNISCNPNAKSVHFFLLPFWCHWLLWYTDTNALTSRPFCYPQ